MSHAVLVSALLTALAPLPGAPAAPWSGDCKLLQQVAAHERPGAASESITYRGIEVNVETGAESRFALAVQRGDQLLFVLRGNDGAVRGSWVYQRGTGWGWTPGSAVSALTGDSLQSWRLVALVFSPNSFSALRRQVQTCRALPVAPLVNPVLHVILTGGLEVDLTLDRHRRQLVRVERRSGATKRTIAIIQPGAERGRWLDGFRTLRDGVPHRLYRIESAANGKLLPEMLFTQESMTTSPLAEVAP